MVPKPGRLHRAAALWAAEKRRSRRDDRRTRKPKKADGYYDLIGQARPDNTIQAAPSSNTRLELKQTGTIQCREGACAFAFPPSCKHLRRGKGKQVIVSLRLVQPVHRVGYKVVHGRCRPHLLVGVKSVDN